MRLFAASFLALLLLSIAPEVHALDPPTDQVVTLEMIQHHTDAQYTTPSGLMLEVQPCTELSFALKCFTAEQPSAGEGGDAVWRHFKPAAASAYAAPALVRRLLH